MAEVITISDELLEDLRMTCDFVLTKHGHPKMAFLVIIAQGYEWAHLSTFKEDETVPVLKQAIKEIEEHPEGTVRVYRQ
jgi:hypothetical protein